MPAAERRRLVDARGVVRRYGAFRALDGVSFHVLEGEKVVIIGPSGSGKITLLRSVNGLETIDAGTIIVDGMDIADPRTDVTKVREEVGMVFQSFNLFPHRTVLENVTLAQVVVRRRSPREARERALALLAKVGIAEKAGAYPGKLSGGPQQRVAIARALAMDPKMMLFDEPTSAPRASPSSRSWRPTSPWSSARSRRGSHATCWSACAPTWCCRRAVPGASPRRRATFRSRACAASGATSRAS